MIWVAGRIVPDDAVTISVADRTFEHGLGLFETLRTWNGRAVLLDRHLRRLRESAGILELPVHGAVYPDADAVAALLKANAAEGDVLLRITLSGGIKDQGSGTLWMRVAALPASYPPDGISISLGAWEVSPHDPMNQHKVLNYWQRRMAYEEAQRRGFDEVLSSTSGRYWEGSRTNLFVVEGDRLRTPSTRGPLVSGVMRRLVLELARELPLAIEDDLILTRRSIGEASEVFLTNSVRGIIPVRRAVPPVARRGIPIGGGPAFEPWVWPAPGRWTRRLALLLSDWLHAGGKNA
jgi:branched-subunit amino acid aminotransferase/4-amino-4-deoxychorismate lyase